MSAARTAAVVVLGIVLTLTLATSNLVFAAHASVLDPGFVTDSIEEENGYEALAEEMQRAVENATSEATGGELGGSFGALLDGDPVKDAVTPQYVQSQVDPNIGTIYAYLHGNTDRLNLTMDLRPLAENAGENVGDSIRNATVTELIEAAPGDPFADVPVDASFVQELNDSPESYADAKESLRAPIRAEILDAAVDEAFAEASNDELLALVIPDYDPRDYSEEEKEEMVEDREQEIRDALRERIEEERGDEIDAAVQERLDEMREEAAGVQPSADEVGNQAIADAAGDLQMAVLTAATTDQSYEEYRAEVTSARDDLGTAIGDYVTEQFTQEASVIDLNEQMEIAEQGELQQQRTIVGYLDLSAIVLPVLAILLIGGVWFVTRSIVVTTLTAGVSLLVAALPALVGAPIAGDRLRSMMETEGDGASTLEPLIQGIIDRVIGTVTGQSLMLVIVGLVLLAVALAIHYDVHERIGDARGAR